jgi:hypothetical protein
MGVCLTALTACSPHPAGSFDSGVQADAAPLPFDAGQCGQPGLPCCEEGLCQEGATCSGGSCIQNGSGRIGTSCSTDTDCESGLCLALANGMRACTTSCSGDGGCLAGWTCGALPGRSILGCRCTPLAAVTCDGKDDLCDGTIDEEPAADEWCQADGGPTLVCQSGACECGLTCDSTCVDPMTDPANCGGCGQPCAAPTSACVGGACTCPDSEQLCDGGCVDVTSDFESCGQCGLECVANGTQQCAGSQCVVDDEWMSWLTPPDSPPTSTFVVSADGETTTDLTTGLVWERWLPREPCPSDDPINCTWASASAYCASFSRDGLTGWRLPTVVELLSIIDYSQAVPALDVDAFPTNSRATWFWTSTSYAGEGGYAWVVELGIGTTDVLRSNFLALVKCVR